MQLTDTGVNILLLVSLCTDYKIVQENGVAVCQPTPKKAFEYVATFIGDKDTSVRLVSPTSNTWQPYRGSISDPGVKPLSAQGQQDCRKW